MKVLYPRCAGLDVHQKTITACVRIASKRRVLRETRKFAAILIAEIGSDMAVFPTAGHLRSWAGLCPGLHESAGKRRPQKSRHGAPWLKTALVQAAWAATRKHDSYLRAQFFRLKSRRGPRKALLAVASSILTVAYHILKQGTPYRDLGAGYFYRRDKERLTAKMVRRLQHLGFSVTLEPLAHPASACVSF
ncbi:MAG TPA: transposase [Vicinamibacteria bacterium]|nr:transposase [Vicinamibacteria bacterium]